MNYLELALDHASKGYYVFPTQRGNKRPKKGFMDWEANATTDPELIKQWWAEDDYLPAIAPGRTGHAVIDVDRHPGEPDGFETLKQENVTLVTKVTGTSLSGNGTHFWHKHDVGSVNGILVSVDRKAKGGYVVVPYLLPDPESIVEPLPEKLAGSKASANVERVLKSSAQLNTWLRTVGSGEPGEEMWQVMDTFSDRGNQQMSIHVARVVSLAALGHPGGTAMLDTMYDKWMSGAHSSGDPEEEFRVNVKSAIEKFGEPKPDTSKDDEIFRLLADKKESTINILEMEQSLAVFCTRHLPGWRERESVARPFTECVRYLSSIRSLGDAKTWREKTKEIMLTVIERENHGEQNQS